MSRQERINVHKKQGRIDSVKQSFKDDTSIVVNPLSVLQDSTGGTISDVLVDAAGGSYPTDEEYVNSVASLAAKINSIILALKSLGIVK